MIRLKNSIGIVLRRLWVLDEAIKHLKTQIPLLHQTLPIWSSSVVYTSPIQVKLKGMHVLISSFCSNLLIGSIGLKGPFKATYRGYPHELIKKTGRGPELIKNNWLRNQIWGILTWIGEFRPRNKTVYVVFDEESDFLVPGRNSFIQTELFRKHMFFYISFIFWLVFFLISSLGYRVNTHAFLYASLKHRVVKHTILVFFQGVGVLRELQEASRNEFHLSWCI